MGEPQTSHFYDLGTFGCVLEPPKQLFCILETPGHVKQIKEITGGISKYIFFLYI